TKYGGKKKRKNNKKKMQQKWDKQLPHTKTFSSRTKKRKEKKQMSMDMVSSKTNLKPVNKVEKNSNDHNSTPQLLTWLLRKTKTLKYENISYASVSLFRKYEIGTLKLTGLSSSSSASHICFKVRARVSSLKWGSSTGASIVSVCTVRVSIFILSLAHPSSMSTSRVVRANIRVRIRSSFSSYDKTASRDSSLCIDSPRVAGSGVTLSTRSSKACTCSTSSSILDSRLLLRVAWDAKIVRTWSSLALYSEESSRDSHDCSTGLESH
ncbi:Unknown protein, partial [Striga hermonthica]